MYSFGINGIVPVVRMILRRAASRHTKCLASDINGKNRVNAFAFIRVHNSIPYIVRTCSKVHALEKLITLNPLIPRV